MMSEAEQTDVLQQVAELTAELANWRQHVEVMKIGVRKLRLELENAAEQRDAALEASAAVEQDLVKMTAERDKAVKVAAAFQDQVASLQEQLQGMAALRAEYLAAKESANTNIDNAAALREQVQVLDAALQERTAERDTMDRYLGQMRDSRDAARKATADVEQDLVKMTAERDHATAQLEECCEDRSRQATVLREHLAETAAMREQLAEMKASRDNFERLCRDWRIEFDALNAKKDDLQVQLSQWQVGHDAIKEQLAQAKENADTFEAENKYLRDTIQQLRAKQVHDDLPGILMVIQRAAEQARELI